MNFGEQRRELLKLAAVGAAMACCGVRPEEKTEYFVGQEETVKTPYFNIRNRSFRAVAFDTSLFGFHFREAFADKPQIFSEIGSKALEITLLRRISFEQPEYPFKQVRIPSDREVWLATGNCEDAFKAREPVTPYDSPSSEILSGLFILGITSWSARRGICKTDEWNNIFQNYLNARGVTGSSANFVGFVPGFTV